MSGLTPYEHTKRQPRMGLVINLVQHVKLSFELTNEDGLDRDQKRGLIAKLSCLTCDEEFVWNGEASWWVCLSCGIELSPEEAAEFLRVAQQSLKDLNADVGLKRGGRWHWVRRLLSLVRRA